MKSMLSLVKQYRDDRNNVTDADYVCDGYIQFPELSPQHDENNCSCPEWYKIPCDCHISGTCSREGITCFNNRRELLLF